METKHANIVLAFVELRVGREREGAVVVLLAVLQEHRDAHPDEGKSKFCVTKSAK